MGTEEDPYQIRTAQQLENIGKSPNSHFVITSDIDINSYLYEYGNGWEPIDDFKGTLDGKGYTLKGLWIKRPNTDYIGLFSSITQATIKDINIEIAESGIKGQQYVGAICGRANSCQIFGCNVKGIISGNYYVGGLFGYISSSRTSKCHVNGIIIGNNGNNVGGIGGEGDYNSTITLCYSEGNIIGSNYNDVYGICREVIVSNCYSLATLTGSRGCYAISNRSATQCYFAGKVSGSSFYCNGTYTYFDYTVSGKTGNNGYSTANMKKQSTYEGWDFKTIWQITEGKTYPILRCFDKDQQEESQQDSGGSNIPFGNDGTLATPFTPAEANAFIATLAADTNTDKDYYIKGKLVKYASNGEFGTQYGNASFYLSADGTESGEQFYVFRTLYLGNMKYSDDSWTKPKTGDEIIICGKLVNYKGNTPETVANKSYIYSLNGKTGTEGSTQSATRINTVRY